jgi:hypothetical protein
MKLAKYMLLAMQHRPQAPRHPVQDVQAEASTTKTLNFQRLGGFT